ncbi:MAG: hypothetical protein BAJALOKI1v1_150005 [Promethearchaeota archaeon]|nr:MAG: hypothetical protein BAJALOKI1v1_150005 [Candidatus Lokiarchaeota archaeon]
MNRIFLETYLIHGFFHFLFAPSYKESLLRHIYFYTWNFYYSSQRLIYHVKIGSYLDYCIIPRDSFR